MASMITFGICAVFLIATVTAIPLLGVYIRSADIYNNQNIAVRCIITWEGPDGPLASKDSVIIDAKQTRTIYKRDIDMGSYTAGANIKTIQCGNFVLNAPFAGAYGIQLLWQFKVEKTNILSVGPNPRE